MYPKNAASPQRIAVGAVVQISDGAVQTSGVTVSVTGQGGSETGSAGTIAYSTGGIVFYTPTQAETNYTSFIVTAYKTGCVPVSATIVTSASAVSGYAGLDWATINAPTTTQVFSGSTVGVVTLTNTLTTYTGNTVQTGDSFARIGVAGVGLSNVGANVTKVNGTTIGGSGTAVSPWGPA